MITCASTKGQGTYALSCLISASVNGPLVCASSNILVCGRGILVSRRREAERTNCKPQDSPLKLPVDADARPHDALP